MIFCNLSQSVFLSVWCLGSNLWHFFDGLTEFDSHYKLDYIFPYFLSLFEIYLVFDILRYRYCYYDSLNLFVEFGTGFTVHYDMFLGKLSYLCL